MLPQSSAFIVLFRKQDATQRDLRCAVWCRCCISSRAAKILAFLAAANTSVLDQVGFLDVEHMKTTSALELRELTGTHWNSGTHGEVLTLSAEERVSVFSYAQQVVEVGGALLTAAVTGELPHRDWFERMQTTYLAPQLCERLMQPRVFACCCTLMVIYLKKLITPGLCLLSLY